MVNLLEVLYGVTALAALLAFLFWLRARRTPVAAQTARLERLARRFGLGAAGTALICVLLYWYLSPA